MNSGKSQRYSAAISIMVLLLLSASFVRGQDLENFTYRLNQSTGSYQFWTTPPAEGVFKDDTVPSDTGLQVKIYAAKNEFEPFQVIVKPTASGTVVVGVPDFGEGITTELFQVKYIPITTLTDYFGRTGDNPDPLWPLPDGATVSCFSASTFPIYAIVQLASGDMVPQL